MSDFRRTQPEEVDHLLRNAQLRDELEPFFDEAIEAVNVAEMPTPLENEYLASMLAWEKAPVVPIAEWFTPALTLPRPDALDDEDLHDVLTDIINKLYEKKLVLDFTDHLSDQALYCLILRDILPSQEKKIDQPGHYLHWDCCNSEGDPETWLRYYATEEDRELWADQLDCELPSVEEPPHPRVLPRAPF